MNVAKGLKHVPGFAGVAVAVVVAVLAVGDAAGWPFARGFVRFPAMMARFTAKTVCSCVFVSGRSDEQCGELARQSPPIASFVVDRANATVRARALLSRKVASYQGADLGCVVDD